MKTTTTLPCRSPLQREETPLPGHAVEVVRATIHEAQARAGDQVLDGTGDENLAGARRYSGADVNGDTPHVVAHQLALAGVQPGSDLYPQRADAVADGAGTMDRPRGAVESGKEAVPHRADGGMPRTSAPPRSTRRGGSSRARTRGRAPRHPPPGTRCGRRRSSRTASRAARKLACRPASVGVNG